VLLRRRRPSGDTGPYPLSVPDESAVLRAQRRPWRSPSAHEDVGSAAVLADTPSGDVEDVVPVSGEMGPFDRQPADGAYQVDPGADWTRKRSLRGLLKPAFARAGTVRDVHFERSR
jgi:hypothetical protein